jgi:uncharacterized protein (UPF0332 family)
MENQEQSNEFGNRVFQQFMDLFVNPEVRKRQDAGELPKPLDLRAAQIIFFADGRKPQVRINKEIRAIAKVKFKEGISKNPGEPVFAHEIEDLAEINLTGDDDPDCGHATLIKINDRWTIAFDFRYYKGLSRNHIKTASEFYEAAEFSYSKKNWSAFVDNLFSCAELSAKVVLLTFLSPGLVRKATHKLIQQRYNGFADLGNVDETHRSVLNKLSGWRTNARYLKGRVPVSEDEAVELLNKVKDMLKYAKGNIGMN